jgi:hypothetical protein
MAYICPKCGANFISNETCQDRFNAIQLIELERPEYYAVHNLSVPCYMLQHNVYSQRGWLAVRELLFQFVYNDLAPELASKQHRIKYDSGHRKWSFTKGPKLPGVEKIEWSFTIADVRLDTAEIYCKDILHWAKSILVDSKQLIETINKEK